MAEELAAACGQLEEAIREVGQMEGFEGLLTDWVVVAAYQRFEEDGRSVTTIGRLVPARELPYHRMLGLLGFALARAHAEICEE